MKKIAEIPTLDPTLAIMPIGTVADALGVHQRTLRIYDKQEILSPGRSQKNRRYYSINDVQRAKLVLFLTRNLALNLSGVKIILAMLEEQKISPMDYMTHIEKIAKKAKIDTSIQQENITKTSKRGRKPKAAK